MNSKIKLFQGDITRLKIGAITNAANSGLHAGGGICGAIHDAAGRQLAQACDQLGGCDTGNTAITPGFKLHADYVLHTVGPIGEAPKELDSCCKYTAVICSGCHSPYPALC